MKRDCIYPLFNPLSLFFVLLFFFWFIWYWMKLCSSLIIKTLRAYIMFGVDLFPKGPPVNILVYFRFYADFETTFWYHSRASIFLRLIKNGLSRFVTYIQMYVHTSIHKMSLKTVLFAWNVRLRRIYICFYTLSVAFININFHYIYTHLHIVVLFHFPIR